MPLRYRAALVTGASSGIGRAIAIALRGAGMNVFALGRDAEALAALEAQCGATPVVGDVRDRGATAALLSAHEIDVLVNNAGVLGSRGPFQDADPDALGQLLTSLTLGFVAQRAMAGGAEVKAHVAGIETIMKMVPASVT